MTTTTLSVERPSDDAYVPTPTPPLSWVTETDAADWTQVSAEVELVGSTTATIDGADSVLVAWPFPPLTPRQEATLRVRVTGSDGVTGEWSEPLTIRGGFLAEGEWHASPIGLADPSAYAQAALLRHEFEVDGEVRRATLYATALGSYQVAINGEDVDDQVLKPGWTAYQFRIVHETTDVTALLSAGTNAIGVRLAGAWASESFGFRGHEQSFYADQPTASAQLVIEYADGRTVEVVTGAGWTASTGPIVASGIYDGEHYDARLAQPGFATAGFDAAASSSGG